MRSSDVAKRGVHALQDKLRALFEAEGFRCDALTVREKTVENRALDLRMPRRWVQAVFTYVGYPAARAAEPARGWSGVRSLALSNSLGGTDSRTDAMSLSCRATDADGQRSVTEAGESQTGHQGAAAADAACSAGNACEDSGAIDEWDAPPDEGVLGSDVGGLFQEPLEMVQEAIALAPGFTVQASAARAERLE